VQSEDGRLTAVPLGDVTLVVEDETRAIRVLPKGRAPDLRAAARLLGTGLPENTVARRPDGSQLAIADRGGIRIVSLETGADLRSLPGEAAEIAYSPDGARLAAAFRRRVRIFDVDTGKQERPVDLAADITIARPTWSPDGTRLAVAGFDHTVRVLDVASGREVRAIRGNEATVVDFAFVGTTRFACLFDETLQLWDLDVGRVIVRIECLRGGRVAASADGRWLACVGPDEV
jgi:WD40 repeat protein